MRKTLHFLSFFFAIVWISAQKDSVYIQATISNDHRFVEVKQDLIYYNKTSQIQTEIPFLNWISAYKNKGTELAKRKLEDREKELYFAKPDDLGKLTSLEMKINSQNKVIDFPLDQENFILKLTPGLKPNEGVKIHFKYQLQLPSNQFTGYGTSKNTIALKYFFLIPDGFPEIEPREKKFIDTEETSNFGTFWTVDLDLPANYFSKSNLPEIQPNYFQGILQTDPEFLVTNNHYPTIVSSINGKKVTIDFGYNLTEIEKENLEFYLPLHLSFISEKIGFLPEKIFISEKFKKKEDFFGNDDIKFWKLQFPLFSPEHNVDLDYFSLLSKNVLEQSFVDYKNTDHWLVNGLKTYLEIQYLEAFYKDEKLLGALREKSILGIKPLKMFHASDLKLSERYSIAYQYIMTQNLDQRITEPYSSLSNLNQMIISNFEMGGLFKSIADKMGNNNFETFLKDYFQKNSIQRINSQDFLDQLVLTSQYSSLFVESLIQKKQRANFTLKKFKRQGDELTVKVKKNVSQAIPFTLETLTKNNEKNDFWLETTDKKSIENYQIPDKEIHKMVINSDHYFPEKSFRDNYIYTKGIFANTKKLKFKLFRDVPNPEYNEIYLNPRFNFNIYDKILIGLNFKNQSLFDQNFEYSFTPYYSTGTRKLTGSGAIAYTFMPAESFYRSLDIGISGSYFHYDYDLSYRRFSAFMGINFTKNPRSAVGRNFGISYNHYQKDLTPEMILENEYEKYNLWNVSYGYSDSKLINEKYYGIHLQGMEDFQKISAEVFFRHEFAKNKKISFRVFAGYFLKNTTRNHLFDYGISKVSNYSFSYGLLGQSATSGFLSQQFILADGGFKSFFNGSVNQWITSTNIDSHVWKMFNLYGDAGFFKVKNSAPKFLWDSGVKVRIIPDFFEIYLPVYSSLGFEPSFKDYGKRIRFTLVLNFGALVGTFRRGWY